MISGRVPLVLRWLARAAAFFLCGAFLALVVSEITNPHSGPPALVREWVGIFLLSLCFAGMLIAWKWELTGAVLSLLALSAFALLVAFRQYVLLGILALPGVLYLADWILRPKPRPPERGSTRFGRAVG